MGKTIEQRLDALEKQDEILTYIVAAQATVDQALAAWELYGSLVSLAYSQAYDEQAGVLAGIKGTIDSAKQFAAKLTNFLFTAITVAVAGPLASLAMKNIAAKAADATATVIEAEQAAQKAIETAKSLGQATNATINRIKNAGSYTKDVAQESAKDSTKKSLLAASEQLARSLQSPSSEDAFKPVDEKPEQYGYRVQANINERVLDLRTKVKDFVDFWEQNRTNVNLADAKSMYQSILDASFIKNPPKVKQTDLEKLKRSASLALWLSWAWDRDIAYWIRDEHNDINPVQDNIYSGYYYKSGQSYWKHPYAIFDPRRFANEEPQYFDVLLKKLPVLGIPAAKMSQYFDMGRDATGLSRIDGTPHMDMYAFINWSFTSEARRLLFSGLPMDPLGQKYTQEQLTRRSMETQIRKRGWVEVQ